MEIIGRKEEIRILAEKYASNQSEFVAVYGRRRVGKTFLIRQVFDRKFTLQLTGVANANLQIQLEAFNRAITDQQPRYKKKQAQNWSEAFMLLKKIINDSKQKKKVIFIDELPWFDTLHLGFIQQLEHFWNSWASARKDVMLIVCGSAASWMLNKLIKNKGGLHNRVTQRIKLEPFTLNESEKYAKHQGLKLDHYQLLQLYMTLGGIPYYWYGITKGKSAAQIIQHLCFDKNGLLVNEFQVLYQSIFYKAQRHEAIVYALAKKVKGLTRQEISTFSGLANGGCLTRLLEELEESGFIRKYVQVGKKNRDSLYQLCDFFTLFHLKFMQINSTNEKNYWLKKINSPQYRAWSGYAFEQICLWHVEQIKEALGISGIETEVSSWRSVNSSDGAQIDLVIDRKDGVVNLCEMKFSVGEFVVDKRYEKVLQTKVNTFASESAINKTYHLILITTFGLKENIHSGGIQQCITMNMLFD
jgi:hypothetical protein